VWPLQRFSEEVDLGGAAIPCIGAAWYGLKNSIFNIFSGEKWCEDFDLIQSVDFALLAFSSGHPKIKRLSMPNSVQGGSERLLVATDVYWTYWKNGNRTCKDEFGETLDQQTSGFATNVTKCHIETFGKSPMDKENIYMSLPGSKSQFEHNPRNRELQECSFRVFSPYRSILLGSLCFIGRFTLKFQSGRLPSIWQEFICAIENFPRLCQGRQNGGPLDIAQFQEETLWLLLHFCHPSPTHLSSLKLGIVYCPWFDESSWASSVYSAFLQ